MKNKRFYFDYAASTPVDPEVERAMRPYFLEKFGNAGSLHSFGQEAVAAVDHARETIANAIGAQFREVIFTGSATEANNLAIRGIAKGIRKPRIIVSAIEHESILETAHDLEKEGVEVIVAPVNRNGTVNLEKLEAALNERTVLVSVMYANNEIGTIQPIKEISKLISESRKQKTENRSKKNSEFYPLFHTDAVQAFQFLDCNVNELGVDLMTLSAHKIYGPKGAGALYVRNSKFGVRGQFDHRSSNIEPVITGGGQEFGLRSGTENVPLIAGFGKAVELAMKHRAKEAKRIAGLRDVFWKGLKKTVPRAERNGDPKNCLPNTLNVYFPHHEAQDLLTRFDLAGIAVSAGSACAARSAEPSYVIEALGYPKARAAKGEPRQGRAKKSIRFSFGRPTMERDIHAALEIIKKLLRPFTCHCERSRVRLGGVKQS